MSAKRDRLLRELRNEIDARIQHGANSGGHLEYVLERLDAALAYDMPREITHTEWSAMSAEEQDDLIATGWHLGLVTDAQKEDGALAELRRLAAYVGMANIGTTGQWIPLIAVQRALEKVEGA